VIGTGLGVVCTCFNTPFDVVKSRCATREQLECYGCYLPSSISVSNSKWVAVQRGCGGGGGGGEKCLINKACK
jgi:hypothetical protein